MPKLSSIITFLALGASTLLATGPVPRKSPEFKIVEPSGKQTLLSSFKGKVVLIEFMLTNETNLENENYLRNLIDSLLKEGAPPGDTQK